jgi:flagellar hook-basal body complex protein FliE
MVIANPIQIGGVAGIAPIHGTQQPATPFGGIFQSLVDQTGSLDQKAQQAVTGLLNGTGVEVHDAMIATQKSDMAFELALQVRNKAVGAYQQMMSMQF